MIDSVQLVLLIVIIILTVLLVALGIQVFFILTDFHKTIRKANHVLDNANNLTDSVSGPLATVSALVGSLKGGSILVLVKLVRSLLSRDGKESSEHKHKKE